MHTIVLWMILGIGVLLHIRRYHQGKSAKAAFHDELKMQKKQIRFAADGARFVFGLMGVIAVIMVIMLALTWLRNL